MSRTYKDTPYNVRVLRKMRDGHEEHDHHAHLEMGKERPEYREGYEVIEFDKKDAKEIFAFRQYLEEHEYSYTEKETDKIHYDVRSEDNNYRSARDCHEIYAVHSKKIVFTIHVLRKNKGYRSSDYCADVEHFEPSHFTDTRDGKMANCVPYLTHYDKKEYRSGGGWGDYEKRYSKTARKMELKKVAQTYNTYAQDIDDFDELEDLSGFHEPAVYTEVECGLWF